jgi:hypothetical protein
MVMVDMNFLHLFKTADQTEVVTFLFQIKYNF